MLLTSYMICLLSHHSCIQADDFTAKLFGIYKQVQTEGQTQVKQTDKKTFNSVIYMEVVFAYCKNTLLIYAFCFSQFQYHWFYKCLLAAHGQFLIVSGPGCHINK